MWAYINSFSFVIRALTVSSHVQLLLSDYVNTKMQGSATFLPKWVIINNYLRRIFLYNYVSHKVLKLYFPVTVPLDKIAFLSLTLFRGLKGRKTKSNGSIMGRSERHPIWGEKEHNFARSFPGIARPSC
jgi:hypothetical protein